MTNALFENDVKMYGTQTDWTGANRCFMFENDVKMYGTQTIPLRFKSDSLFENDVKMYGTQTKLDILDYRNGVWEWCKNVWYSNLHWPFWPSQAVWEWCKNVWYSNSQMQTYTVRSVWEWCKNVWYSNCAMVLRQSPEFENDVKMYGTQT